jgi:hypothetical protein
MQKPVALASGSDFFMLLLMSYFFIEGEHGSKRLL